jgi:hypothetical protein
VWQYLQELVLYRRRNRAGSRTSWAGCARALDADNVQLSILEAAKITPADVRLLRHKDKPAKPGRTPYDLWRVSELCPMFDAADHFLVSLK